MPNQLLEIRRLLCVCLLPLFFIGLLVRTSVIEAGETAPVIVTGNVTDETGKAIVGATVEWGRVTEPFSARQRVQTDNHGNYRIAMTSAKGLRHLAASAPGFSVQVESIGVEAGQRELTFVLKKAPGNRPFVSGRIVDERGDPIAGARVEAFTPVVGFHSSFSMPTGRDYFPGPDRVAVTDADGRFRIDDLITDFLPIDEIQLNVRAKHRHINDENYTIGDNIRVVMRGSGKAGLIQGRIVDSVTGEPPADLGSVRIVRRHIPTAYECTHDDGRFTLPVEVTLGNTYMVYVYAKRFAAMSARLKAVAPNSSDYAKVELIEGPMLRGKIVDADTGEPIAGASLVYGIAADAWYFSWPDFHKYVDGYHSLTYVQHDTANKRGAFWFAEPGEGGSRGTIFVKAEGYQRLVLEPDSRTFDASTGELVIRLPRESVLVGVVTSDGKTLPRTTLWVSPPKIAKMEQWYEHVHTDTHGRYRYGQFSAGTYNLRAGPYTRTVTLGKGQTLTVNMGEDLGPLSVHGTAVPNTRVTFIPAFDWEYKRIETRSDEFGKFSLRGLRRGRYRVVQELLRQRAYRGDKSDIEVEHDNQQIDLAATSDPAAGPTVPAGLIPKR
jgi:protocatechuate 3,4-dioxygenase beta subunit